MNPGIVPQVLAGVAPPIDPRLPPGTNPKTPVAGLPGHEHLAFGGLGAQSRIKVFIVGVQRFEGQGVSSHRRRQFFNQRDLSLILGHDNKAEVDEGSPGSQGLFAVRHIPDPLEHRLQMAAVAKPFITCLGDAVDGKNDGIEA